MTAARQHRLDGLEPDNLLAFLALLGLLRALETDDRERSEDEKSYLRAFWALDAPPLRPVIVSKVPLSREALLDAAARGVDILAKAHEFGGRKDLDYSCVESRTLLTESILTSQGRDRHRIDMLSALMSDGAVKEKDKEESVDPTPLCLLFGQGHQHFLDRFATVPRQPAPPPIKKKAAVMSAAACLGEALFEPWHRKDTTFSFRWDPAEDVRYAMLAGDPTDGAFKTGTQHGANRLAAIGLCALSVVPEVRAGRVRPAVIGGAWGADGFSFSWPIWRDPTSLASIRALLSHPHLGDPTRLAHLGVDHVMTSQRISVGKYMNVTRARLVRESVVR